MLVLIDTVADSSRDVKLIDGDTLFERFAKRASVAEAPEVDELVREAEADIDAVLGRTDGVSANVVKFRAKSEMKAPCRRGLRPRRRSAGSSRAVR